VLALQLELCLPRLVSSPGSGDSIDGLRAFSRNPGRRASANTLRLLRITTASRTAGHDSCPSPHARQEQPRANRRCNASGSTDSPSEVDPTTSQNSTVTTFRCAPIVTSRG
jgi:hypothetical protein